MYQWINSILNSSLCIRHKYNKHNNHDILIAVVGTNYNSKLINKPMHISKYEHLEARKYFSKEFAGGLQHFPFNLIEGQTGSIQVPMALN